MGSARVFELINNSYWDLKGNDLTGNAQGDRASALAMSSDGTTVALGATLNDDAGPDAGRVGISYWTEQAELNDLWEQKGTAILGEAAGDKFSHPALNVDGSRLAISAWGKNGETGRVRVFDWTGTAWQQVGQSIDGESAGDRSIALDLSSSGHRLAIGAPLNDGNGTDNGHVRVFEYNQISDVWVQMGADINGEGVNNTTGDNAGVEVALNGDGSMLVMGAPLNDGGGADSGSIRIFTWDSSSGGWQHQIDIDGSAGDKFGNTVAMSDDGATIVAGAPSYDNFRGYFTIFQFIDGNWIETKKVLGGSGDNLGYGVGVSADGTTVIVSGIQGYCCSNAGYFDVYRRQ